MDRFGELETFVRVVEAGGFTAAAERLGMAKSAVSRRVSELEERLGVRLLNRTTRRLSLTESGRQLFDRAVPLLADLDETEQSVADRRAELRGRMRIAAPLSFGLLHLAPVIAELLTAHPHIVLDLDLNDRMINLVEEGFDLAVRIGRLPDSSLVARRLAPIRFVAVASAGYLASHGEPREPEDLAAHQGLIYSNIPEASHWSFQDGTGRERIAKVPVRLRSSSGELLLRAAMQGIGVAVTPTFLAYRAIESGELIPILRDFRLPAAAMYAIYPSQRHLTRRVRVLIDALAERFGDHPYWDECLTG